MFCFINKNSANYCETIKKKVDKKFSKDKTKKIHLLFVCHRPAVWNYLKSVYENAINDDRFQVTIVTIPKKNNLKNLGFSHEIYDDEGAYEYFKSFNCTVINGFNKQNNKFLDLKKLKPHYIFFQQPYNAMRPKEYHSKRLFKIAKLCFVFYGHEFLNEKYEQITYSFGNDYFKYMYFIFASNQFERLSYIKGIKDSNCNYNYNNIIITGSPVFDYHDSFKDVKNSIWKNQNNFKILRNARWCTSEKNCTFLEYEKLLFDFCESKDINLVYRPHPQAFQNYILENIMTEYEIEKMIERYNLSKNNAIDLSKDYKEIMYSSDILITDPSGLAFEYLATEKPIIYTKKSNESLNEIAIEIFNDACYCVENWQELEQTIMMLKSGYDPKKQKRLDIIRKYLKISNNAGKMIINIIAKDFYEN